MKKIIAVNGTRNVGKTTSINLALQAIRERYPTAEVTTLEAGWDFVVVVNVTINGRTILVVIASAGDVEDILLTLLARPEVDNCDILVCATKTYGATVNAIEAKLPDSDIVWIAKSRAAPGHEEAANRETANVILQAIETIVGDGGQVLAAA